MRIEIDAPSAVVFDVLHDYAVRLQWDGMLSEARLVGPALVAGKGARSLCVGTWRTGFVPMETEYVTFRPGRVAAVRLTNRPPLFDRFAASIRHSALDARRSSVTYTYSFRTRPRPLSPLLDPLVAWVMMREVRARLAALREFVERRYILG